MRVLDGAIGIFCAVAGVESQSETVWRQANRYNVPRLIFINKMDRRGACFEAVVEELHSRLGANAVPLQLPVGSEAGFRGIIDLLEMKALLWDDDGPGAEYREIAISDDLMQKANDYRRQLLEKLAEIDDLLMEDYLAGFELPVKRIKRVLREAVIRQEIYPVFCGAAFKNKGIQPLLDAVVEYLPSPAEIPPITVIQPNTGDYGQQLPADSEPFTALAFKVVSDPYVGKLNYIRVYSGVLKAGDQAYNSTADRRERIVRFLRMHANDREEIREVHTGDIVAVAGLKKTTTGDTLCTAKKPVILESMVFPEPVVSIAIEPESSSDGDKLMESLKSLADEDPTFKIRYERETGQTVISGMGELHLEILVERLFREHQVKAAVGNPEVAYRETITAAAKAEGRFVKQSGGRGFYGHVVMCFEPLPSGTGFLFESRVTGGGVPKEYIPAVKKGIEEAAANGVLAGYPMVDFRAILLDGSAHQIDSNEPAFKIAASMAYKNGLEQAKPIILEPIMSVEVFTPEEYLGKIISDLSTRLGKIEGIEERQDGKVVKALVPLEHVFGYTTALRSVSKGRASHTTNFDSYQPAAKKVQEKIIRKSRGE
ncbi:Elongation factor G [subsurface metagenome]